GAERLPVVGDVEVLDALAQLLGALGGRLQGRIRQDQDKLLAAIPAGDVVAAQVRPKETAEFAKDRVAGFVPKGIIKDLEVVDIEHDDAQRLWGARDAPRLSVKRFFEIAAIEQAGEGIADRLAAQRLAQMQIGQ